MQQRRFWSARRVIALGLGVVALLISFYGFGLVYQHARSPDTFADVRCSERFPPKGPDTTGRAACLVRERDRTAGDVMQSYGTTSLALAVVGGMLWIFGRPPAPVRESLDPWNDLNPLVSRPSSEPPEDDATGGP